MRNLTMHNSHVLFNQNRLWLVYAAVCAVLLPLSRLVGLSAQAALYVLFAASAAGAVVLGVRLHRPRRKVAWYFLAAAVLSSLVGAAIYGMLRIAGDEASQLASPADAFFLASYGASAVGLLLLLRSGSRHRDAGSVVDAAVITVSAALLLWAFLISPIVSSQEMPRLHMLVAAGYPVGDLLVLSLGARLAFNASSRVPSFFALLTGLGVYLATDAIYGHQVLHGRYESGGLLDAGWLLGYAIIGSAALHPSMRQIEERSGAPGDQLSWFRLLIVTFIPVAALAVLAARAMVTETSDSAVVLVGALGLFLLALLRIALLAREVNAANKEVRASRERYDLMSLATNDVIWDLDPRAGTLIWSDAIATSFGHATSSPSLAWWTDLIHGDDVERVSRALQHALDGSSTAWTDDYRLRRGDGSYAWVIDRGFIVRNQGGEAVRMVGAITDVSARRELEERLQYQAFHDSLTGLHNREVFRERLLQAMTRQQDSGAARLAVLFIDVDRFKYINDTLGHGAGDRLLIEIARRLGDCIRSTDTLSRLGGDEFTILLDGADEEQARAAAQRIGAALQQPIDLGDHEVVVTASIGISLGDLGEDGADDMIRAADVAMYDAKARGRARYEVFGESHQP